MPAKWNPELEFKPSRDLSIGVELELQILNSRDYNLARDAGDLLALLERTPHPGAVKPEITESMIEVNTSVHLNFETLHADLLEIRNAVSKAAAQFDDQPHMIANMDTYDLWMAFLRDPDGNLLGIMSEVPHNS